MIYATRQTTLSEHFAYKIQPTEIRAVARSIIIRFVSGPCTSPEKMDTENAWFC
jgi:hypothetical protein